MLRIWNTSFKGEKKCWCILSTDLRDRLYDVYGTHVVVCPAPVPEIIDTVFAKTSPKRSFSMTEYERFRLVFTKTRVYKFGHWSLCVPAPLCHRCCVVSAEQQPQNWPVIAKIHPSSPLYSEGLGTGMTRLFILLQEKTKNKDNWALLYKVLERVYPCTLLTFLFFAVLKSLGHEIDYKKLDKRTV